MDDAVLLLLIRDEEGEDLLPAPREVDDGHGSQPGDEAPLIGLHGFGDEDRVHLNKNGSPEGGEPMGVAAGPGVCPFGQGADRQVGGPFHLPHREDLPFGEDRKPEVPE